MKKVDADVENLLMRKCNSCSDILKYNIYCEKCNSLAGDINLNYFELFNIDINFNINLEQLETTYFAILQYCHPDKYNAHHQQDLANRYSSIINSAYKILANVRLRGEYILSLNNIIVNSENDTLKPDMMLITEIFEIRDELDMISSLAALNAFVKNINLEINNIKLSLAHSFSNNNLNQAGSSLIKLRYFEKILEEAKLKKRNI